MSDREERFAEALDALSRGEPLPNPDDLSRFSADARMVWSQEAVDSPSGPGHLSSGNRRNLWAAIQHDVTTSRTIHEGSPVMTGASPATPTFAIRQSGSGAVVTRWQPVLSVTVMFALLIGLVGIAYTGLNRRDNDHPPVAGLVVESTPAPALACDVHGPPVRTFSELSAMSPADWPVREYAPVAVANPAMGLLAQDVYESWITCAWVFADDSAASELPDEMIRFWSDRMQYTHMLDRNPSFRPGELNELRGGSAINDLLLYGALPLNRPPVEVEGPVAGETYPSFMPGDVYELADGRYGVVIGSISTEQLAGSESAESEAQSGVWLTFLAFVESDGNLLIDEYISFCVSTPAMPFYGTADVADCEPEGASGG